MSEIILHSVVFALIGIVLLIVGYLVIEKITPENTWKEITQNKNVALAIVLSSFILGLSFIIGSAIHG